MPKDIPSALESAEVDLAIGSLHPVPDGLFQRQLFTHPFVTIVNRTNPAIGNALPVEQFYEMEHVTVALMTGQADTKIPS
jgi:DNA-binding transcriptional LysR family regulator